MNTIFKKKVVVKVDNTVDIKVFKYIQYLSDIFLNDIYFITFLRGQLNVYVKKPKLFFLLSFFKNHSNTQFKLLNDIFAIDYIKYNKFFRFELVYSLLSVLFNTRLFIKVHTDEFTAIQSVTQLFAGAN